MSQKITFFIKRKNKCFRLYSHKEDRPWCLKFRRKKWPSESQEIGYAVKAIAVRIRRQKWPSEEEKSGRQKRLRSQKSPSKRQKRQKRKNRKRNFGCSFGEILDAVSRVFLDAVLPVFLDAELPISKGDIR